MAISVDEMNGIARARLRDAQTLLKAGRYDGATYLCGYAVEVALKARIIRHLKLTGWPKESAEWNHLTFLKSHDFESLRWLSGQEQRIRTRYFAEWSVVRKWDPEVRYSVIGTATKTNTEAIITATRTLLGALL